MPPRDRAPTLLEAFGEAIRRRRSTLQISQEELGFRSGVHRTYVSELERGLKSPTLATIERLAEALDLRPSGLLRQAENRSRRWA